MTNVLEKPITATTDGNHDRYSHYFRKTDIEAAYFDGTKVTALCGKQDTPTRDFTQYPVCPTCQEALNGIPE